MSGEQGDGFLDTWTENEVNLVVSWHKKVGADWNKIAHNLPGRSADAIQRYWNVKGKWRNM